MITNLLVQHPSLFILWVLAIFYVLSVHEFAHAWTASILGDDTAKRYGRLTLNPLAHLDFLGFLMLILIGFGWGKPVPFNPYNLKNQRFGPALVAVAGPFANLISLIFFSLIFKFLIPFLPVENLLIQFLVFLILLNAVIMVFNLIPIPPLDGSKLLYAFLPLRFENLKFSLERYGITILLALLILDSLFGVGIFNRFFNLILGLVAKIFGL